MSSGFALFDATTLSYVGRDGWPTPLEHDAVVFDDLTDAWAYADRFACEPRLTPIRVVRLLDPERAA